MAENVHNFEVVIDISAIPEFFVNSYDVRYLRYHNITHCIQH